jgi:Ras-related protein Rab-6A
MGRKNESLRSIRSHKVVLVGESSVGKTSVIGRLRDDVFDPHYQATIGIDFGPKVIHLSPERSVKLQLWDTAGQERFRSLIPSYLRDMAACVVVYDITNKKSFEAVNTWVEDARRERGEDANFVLYIVGNKADMRDANDATQVTAQEGEALAQKLNCYFAEVSAKSGNGVSDLFTQIAQKMPQETKPAADAQAVSLDVSKKAPAAQNCSC